MDIYKQYKFGYGDYSQLSDAVFDEVKEKLIKNRKEQIDVTIVVIAFNEERRILPCLCSLADQITDLSYEVIVVNNASTDHTQVILDRCGVQSIFQPLKGVGHARQAGLDVANGRYLFTADADTIYPPFYISTMVYYLQKPGVSAVFSFCRFLPDGQKSRLSLTIYEFFRNLVVRCKSINRPELSAGGASMAFVTEYGKEVGFRTHIRRGEDGAMILGLKNFGCIKLVTNRKVHVFTTSRTLDSDGSFYNMIILRLKREFKRSYIYFSKQKEYKDQDYNMMK